MYEDLKRKCREPYLFTLFLVRFFAAVAIVVCFSFVLSEGREVLLPMKWQALLAIEDNKVDVARFLSDALTPKRTC